MENIIANAFELGLPGFMLLIVLLIVIFFVAKMSNVFIKVPEKFDVLTERIADSNKELSNQLIKTSVIQESILSIMKETMVSVNNNTTRMAVLENKIENNYQKIDEVSLRSEDTIDKLENINLKLETVLVSLQN
jgi:hypothetical protein|nr:MAG TPA: hypothetical protein [Caudoviricetes sp.]